MEACEFTQALAQFAELGAVVVGASPDAPAANLDFRERHRIGFHLLSDRSHETLAAWGAWGMRKMYGRDVEGVIRSTVLLDPEGRVAWQWPNVRAEGHAREVLAKLAELAAR